MLLAKGSRKLRNSRQQQARGELDELDERWRRRGRKRRTQTDTMPACHANEGSPPFLLSGHIGDPLSRAESEGAREGGRGSAPYSATVRYVRKASACLKRGGPVSRLTKLSKAIKGESIPIRKIA